MAYTDCAGTEHQFGTCVGFSYPPYVPPLYCSNSTLAGVKCLGNVELFFILTCTYMYKQVCCQEKDYFVLEIYLE